MNKSLMTHLSQHFNLIFQREYLLPNEQGRLQSFQVAILQGIPVLFDEYHEMWMNQKAIGEALGVSTLSVPLVFSKLPNRAFMLVGDKLQLPLYKPDYHPITRTFQDTYVYRPFRVAQTEPNDTFYNSDVVNLLVSQHRQLNESAQKFMEQRRLVRQSIRMFKPEDVQTDLLKDLQKAITELRITNENLLKRVTELEKANKANPKLPAPAPDKTFVMVSI